MKSCLLAASIASLTRSTRSQVPAAPVDAFTGFHISGAVGMEMLIGEYGELFDKNKALNFSVFFD